MDPGVHAWDVISGPMGTEFAQGNRSMDPWVHILCMNPWVHDRSGPWTQGSIGRIRTCAKMLQAEGGLGGLGIDVAKIVGRHGA